MGFAIAGASARGFVESRSSGTDSDRAEGIGRANCGGCVAGAISIADAQIYLAAGRAGRVTMDKTLELLARYESRNVTFMEADRSWPIVWERARGMYVWD